MNKLDFVKIIKNEKMIEKSLKCFYEYMKLNNITEVEDVKKADLILSFGGDGTLLVAAQETLKNNIPILAINMGTLGYLAEVNPKETFEMIENYKNGNCILDERNFLEIKYKNKKYYALNELLITKGGLMSHLIQVEVYANDIFVNKYRADGIIVSTSTGSTAYSLSAGGAILHPDLEALIITPLAPHSLTMRPIVLGTKEKLSFRVFSRDNDIHMNIDGSMYEKIENTDDQKYAISAELSNKKIKIVRSGNKDYYSILRKKLKWGDYAIK